MVMRHCHHNKLVEFYVVHDHDQSDHDDYGKHNDHTFDDYDLLYGPGQYDHDHGESVPPADTSH